MKDDEATRLQKGDEVMHKKYGPSLVIEVMTDGEMLFGVAICPSTESGQAILTKDSGCPIPNFLETDARRLSYPERANDQAELSRPGDDGSQQKGQSNDDNH